jgi:hypothetical protein
VLVAREDTAAIRRQRRVGPDRSLPCRRGIRNRASSEFYGLTGSEQGLGWGSFAADAKMHPHPCPPALPEYRKREEIAGAVDSNCLTLNGGSGARRAGSTDRSASRSPAIEGAAKSGQRLASEAATKQKWKKQSFPFQADCACRTAFHIQRTFTRAVADLPSASTTRTSCAPGSGAQNSG